MRRLATLAALLLALLPAGPASAGGWDDILAAARGQTVWFNAWGGDPRTNAFIAWAGEETLRRHGVRIVQVKLADTAEAVARVQAEKAAGRAAGGSVDLIWINGPNFLAMKEGGLLYGPFVERLPNAAFLDLTEGAPATRDFTVPVEGMESPWRLARFVLSHDSARLPDPPRSMAALAAWAAAHPGRLTHPAVSNFMGATFLKQALVELAPDPAALALAPDDAAFAAQTAPLRAWYDALRPNLWRGGTAFPETQSVQDRMLADGEIDISMSFDPGSVAAAVAEGSLPATTRVFVPAGGSIGNMSFLAIPFNAAHPEGAMVVANFLLEPSVQARMQDIAVLGSLSVLDPARLDAAARAALEAPPAATALPLLAALGRTLAEPHPGWMTRIVAEWGRRYGP